MIKKLDGYICFELTTFNKHNRIVWQSSFWKKSFVGGVQIHLEFLKMVALNPTQATNGVKLGTQFLAIDCL